MAASRSRRSPLAQDMIGEPGALPSPRPAGSFVGMPGNPPPMFRYGSVQPGPAQNSSFTGARSPNPLGSLMNMQAPAPFTPPTFDVPRSGATAPFVAGGGGGVPDPGALAGGPPTGPYSGPPPSPPPPVDADATHPLGLGFPRQAPTETALGTGLHPTPPSSVALGPGQIGNLPPTNPVGPVYQPLQTLITTLLAQAGQKANPSAPGSRLAF